MRLETTQRILTEYRTWERQTLSTVSPLLLQRWTAANSYFWAHCRQLEPW